MITRRPNHTPALPAPLPLRGSSGQRLPITRRLIVIRGYSVPCTSSHVQYIPPQGSAVLEFGSRIWGPLPTTHYPLPTTHCCIPRIAKPGCWPHIPFCPSAPIFRLCKPWLLPKYRPSVHVTHALQPCRPCASHCRPITGSSIFLPR